MIAYEYIILWQGTDGKTDRTMVTEHELQHTIAHLVHVGVKTDDIVVYQRRTAKILLNVTVEVS